MAIDLAELQELRNELVKAQARGMRTMEDD